MRHFVFAAVLSSTWLALSTGSVFAQYPGYAYPQGYAPQQVMPQQALMAAQQDYLQAQQDLINAQHKFLSAQFKFINQQQAYINAQKAEMVQQSQYLQAMNQATYRTVSYSPGAQWPAYGETPKYAPSNNSPSNSAPQKRFDAGRTDSWK